MYGDLRSDRSGWRKGVLLVCLTWACVVLWLWQVLSVAVAVRADSSQFPEDWLFHVRWNKVPGSILGESAGHTKGRHMAHPGSGAHQRANEGSAIWCGLQDLWRLPTPFLSLLLRSCLPLQLVDAPV